MDSGEIYLQPLYGTDAKPFSHSLGHNETPALQRCTH
jgi:hypothetical protein